MKKVEAIGESAVAQLRGQIDALLIEGLNSGEPVELKPEDWARVRREMRRRVEARRSVARMELDTP